MSSNNEKYTLEEILIENSPVSRNVLKKYLIKYQVLKYECAVCGNTGEWCNTTLTLQIDHINGIRNDNRKENLRWLCPNCHSQTDTFTGRNKTEKTTTIKFTDQEAIKALQQSNNVHQATLLLGCSQGGSNWIRINNIKIANNIIQNDDLAKEQEIQYCQKCGRPLATNATYCQTCIHEFQRHCDWPTREELKSLIRNTPFLQIGQKYNVSDNAVRKWCDYYNLPRKKTEIKKYTDEEWEKI